MYRLPLLLLCYQELQITENVSKCTCNSAGLDGVISSFVLAGKIDWVLSAVDTSEVSDGLLVEL